MLTESQRDALAARLRRGREPAVRAIPRRPAGLIDIPLSYGQEQLWFLDRFAPGQAIYNIPHALSLSGPLDAAALNRALDDLVARPFALSQGPLLRDEHGLADEELGADGIAGLDGMDELDQLATGNLGAVGDGS